MASPLRVAIVGLNYPPESTGIAPYTGAFAAELAERGHDVVANVGHPHYPDWRFYPGYGQWTSKQHDSGLEIRRRRHWVPNPPRGLRRLLSEVTFGLRLLFGCWGPRDVTVAVSPALFSTALASMRPRRVPFVVWVQDIYTLGLEETREGGALAARVTRWVESRTLRRADLVVVIHERMADYVVRNLHVDRNRVEVVRNWTHLKGSEPVDLAGARTQRTWPADTTIVLHAGNMGVKQGLETVLDAARLADQRRENVRFVLLGGGSERERLVNASRDIDRVEFLSPLPDAEFRAALMCSDILLVNELPGVAEMAVPSKLTSYFDAGRPVIAATDPSGITASEIMAASAGIVVPAGDPEALLNAALQIRMLEDGGQEFGKNGRRYRETVLDQAVAIERWSVLLEGLRTG